MPYEITISDPSGELEATFIPETGMVHNSLRHHGEELLHQVGGLARYVSQGSVFANCLLHPWANRLSEWEFDLAGRRVKLDPNVPITHRDGATGTPIHGLLGGSPHWSVVDADRNTVTAQLDFAAVPEYMAAFPFAHLIRYTATVADAVLKIDFTVYATGDQAVPVSFGFHPYLTLPNSDRRSWELKIPVARQALVDERMIPTGETVAIAPGELDGPLGDRTFDTGYDRLLDDGVNTAFSVADDQRRITLTHCDGYPIGQVYTPEEAHFICYEPMTAPVNALITGEGLRWVEPGEDFTASYSISVE
jgi:aldose 1-epimerase